MFDILKSKKDLQEQIESHLKQIDAIGAELQTAIAEKAEAERLLAETKNELAIAGQALESAKMQLEAQAATVADVQSQLEVATNAVIEAKDEAAKAAEITAEKIELEASRLLAASGHPPIKVPKSENQGNKKQISKEDFDRMTPAEKSSFSRNGGRIV